LQRHPFAGTGKAVAAKDTAESGTECEEENGFSCSQKKPTEKLRA